MIPIIAWELRQRRYYILWWSIAMAGLITLLLLVYPSIRDQAEQLNKVLNQLPAGLRELKTGSTSVNIASPIGYLNSQLYYSTLPLLLSIMTIGMGSKLLAKDETDHTLEVLLARPIERTRLLAAKALSGVIVVAIVSTVAALVTVALVKIVGMDVDMTHLLLANAFAAAFSLSFGAIAFALSAAAMFGRSLSVAVATFVVFGGYLLTTLGGMTHYLETPAKFAPYHYYNPEAILQGNFSAGLNAYLIGVFVVCILLGWLGFRRRDLS